MRTELMHKSARADQPQFQGRETRNEPTPDKGNKFEPFYIPAIGSGRRQLALAQRMDQKR